jgi:hypothetical protein
MLGFTRIMAIVFLVTGVTLGFMLLGQLVDVSANPEVDLQLDVTRPAHFRFWHDMEAGYQDGAAGRPKLEKLQALHLAPGQLFELAADPTVPLLRYHEPSVPKRVALLALGALQGTYSVPGLLFWVYGSWLLLKLLQDVTPQTPFTPANARRLAKLTVLVLGLNLWDHVAQFSLLGLVPAFRAAGLASSLNQYVLLNTNELVPGLPVGFMLLVIAAVYRRGVELSQEAELVI